MLFGIECWLGYGVGSGREIVGRAGIPCVALSVHGWEWHAAILDLEEGLVAEVELASGTAGDGLREADDCVVSNDSTLLDSSWGGEGGRRGEKSDEERLERHSE